ncbi:MAG: universal stress protein [Thaumarchaeota archaeon]|nr:universal stress protein [Nitrososphaerota archaeon]MCL5318081.1 universal stress protein [Nitrososphaerota archaeon]
MVQISRILVPTDGSPMSLKAEEMAITLAKQFKGEVRFIHVVSTPASQMPQKEANVALEVKDWEELANEDVVSAKKYLRNALRSAEKVKINASAHLYRTTYSVRESICQIADDLDVDIIVMGTKGRSLKQVILGSVAVGVVTYANRPVLVVR